MLSMDFDAFPGTRLFLAVLLHFIWQAGMIAAVVAIVRGLIRPKYYRARYALLVLGLVVILVAPLATAGYYTLNAEARHSLQPPLPPAEAGAPSLVASGSTPAWLESQFLAVFYWFDGHRLLWLGGWLGGFSLLVLRLCISLRYSIRIRRGRTPLPPHLARIAARLCDKLKMTRNVVVASSRDVTQAVATGVFKPVVLVPSAWVTQLPVPAIEAILAHELAHIKRWDLGVNWLQRLAETVFFFHPLVWWLSRQISDEREVCCDQLAIQVTGQPLQYAETLVHVARQTTFDDSQFQFGTAFVGGKNMNLLRRAKMILEPASIDARSPARTLTLIACVGLLATCGSYAWCTPPDPGNGLFQEEEEEVREVRVRQRGKDSAQEREVLVEVETVNDQEVGDANRDRIHRHLVRILKEGGPQDDHRDLVRQLRELADQLEAGRKSSKSGRVVRGRAHAWVQDKPEGELHIRRSGQGEPAKRVRERRGSGPAKARYQIEMTDETDAPARARYRIETTEPERVMDVEQVVDGEQVMDVERVVDGEQVMDVEQIELKDGVRGVYRLRQPKPHGNHVYAVEVEEVKPAVRKGTVRRGYFRETRPQGVADQAAPTARKQVWRGEYRPASRSASRSGSRLKYRSESRPESRPKAEVVLEQEVREGRATTSRDDLGSVLRELKNEVRQLRREVDQLRQQKNPTPSKRRGARGTDRRPERNEEVTSLTPQEQIRFWLGLIN